MSTKTPASTETVAYPYNNYIIDYGGCSKSDSTSFTDIGNNLFRDKNNEIYFLTFDRSDETGKIKIPVFILRFSNECEGDGDSIYNLSKTIDVPTFKNLGNGAYKDKNHNYHFESMADGGVFSIQPDSATYWVNQKYVDCINAGNSVCNCEEQNDYLILYIDTASNQLIIEPSIYYSWEIFHFGIERGKKNSYNIISTAGYKIDSGNVLNINGNQLTITNSKQTTVFTKITVEQLDDVTDFDLGRQIKRINCKPLLKYTVSPCNDTSKLLLTQEQLSNYIARGQIDIRCSDDYHYTEMYVRNSQTEYFMVYEGDKIKIYKEPTRDRRVKVEVDTLKECQQYSKSK
jgi:hypothetical protein